VKDKVTLGFVLCEEIVSNERISNRIRYTGQQYDEVTNQLYLRARYYNSRLGRFMQEDPYWGDGLNLYIYCHNNPAMYYDPSGYKLEDSDYSKINYDNAGSGYAYYQNKTHTGALKNSGSSTYYEGSSFQSHHMLQGEWANVNLADYGYKYNQAPTISLGTGYYNDNNGNRVPSPHTIASNNQGARTQGRAGDYSSTLNSELVFGATDLIKGGMSEAVVMSELERNYAMIDALNEQNRDEILSGEKRLLFGVRKRTNGLHHVVEELNYNLQNQPVKQQYGMGSQTEYTISSVII